MPKMEVIERDYEKAIEIVRKEYPDVKEGSPEFWSLVFGVVKKMRGRKSARHLEYLGILNKATEFDSLFYLPYVFQQKVSGVELFMDLPDVPSEVPPSALPTFPALLSSFVDLLRKEMTARQWDEREFAERIVDAYLETPIVIPLSDDEVKELIENGSVGLDAVDTNAITENDKLGWKLAWIYAMLNKKIQPLTPRWGYKLAQLTVDVRNVALRRIAEHFQETPMRNPFSAYKQIHKFHTTLQNDAILNGRALVETVKAQVVDVEWKERQTADEYWATIRYILGGIVPAWIAYALHVVGKVKIKDVKFLFRNSLQINEVLCITVSGELEQKREGVLILPKPDRHEDLVVELKRAARNDNSFKYLKDEIVATLTRKWLV